MYKKLSHDLYKLIDKHYVNNSFIYESHFYEKLGRHPNAYKGKGECGLISRLIKNHLEVTKLFGDAKINLYQSEKPQWLVDELRLSVHNHMFIKSDELIIDPTYKQLYFFACGKMEKWDSPYCKYLYSLDPVFIGTPAELENMVIKLKSIRDTDPYHATDVWITDWHSSAQIFHE